MTKKSILEDLGFTMIPRAETDELRKKLWTRSQRRAQAKGLFRPTYTPSSIVTYATDRDGNSWVGPANVDLSVHGFINNVRPFDVNKQRDPRYN